MFWRKQQKSGETTAHPSPSEPATADAPVAEVPSGPGWYHLNPQTGEVLSCVRQSGVWNCPFGADGVHFTDPAEAREAFATKQAEFREWVARSAVPQEPGWFTEHVYNPQVLEDYTHGSTYFPRWPYGTRVVVENGWVLEKVPLFPEGDPDDDVTFGQWKLLAGQDEDGFKLDGTEFMGFDVEDLLKEHGGRVEARDGVHPYALKWKSQAQLYREHDAAYGDIEREIIAERDAARDGQ